MSWHESFLIRFGPGAFSGITLGLWLKVLAENHFAIDSPYWGRAAMITMGSIPTTVLARFERMVYGRKLRATKPEPPLFILGIWRSGTTHLHNLLAQDDRFAYINNYQAWFPNTFLSTERINSKFVASLVPMRRPQDNMTVGICEPQEDEFAFSSLIGRNFPMIWAFPRRPEQYHRYLTFRAASASEVAEWKAALVGLVRKLTFKYGKPLVLKSPGHTCRIKLLLDLFPDAKFVHIHRNPYNVFQSTHHLFQTVTPWWALQRPAYGDLEDRVIQLYKEVYEVFFEERGLIPRGHFYELGFEQLEADPIGQVRGIYKALKLPNFEHAEPALRRYVDSVADYKKNVFPELSADLRKRIAREWRRCFVEWSYPV